MSNKNLFRDENLDEIVFAHRNKNYGAYELRKRYNNNVTRALIFTFIFFAIAAITPLVMAFKNNNNDKIINETIEANLIKIDNPNEKIIPPPAPKTEIKVEKVRYTAPVIVDSVDENVEIKPNDEIINNIKPDDPEIKDYVPPVIKDEDVVVDFWRIEEKPEFPGGEEALLKWIAENTKYPQIPKEEGVTGKVFVSFVIDKNGDVTNVELLNNVDPYLDKEAIRVISSLPKWKPGKQGGQSVKVSFRLPIKFMLY